ncbi:hypothetical protein BDA96_09G134900 [Sorghum bicolor]|uniref:Uncharacterized protein n=1 Tax=Sorghum bicolor TaxID=4558 RepID=A0A921QA14_SORBI|nr:hypothetical protein BDA96_09G134900 [Sorghum bicolor]
MADRMEGSRLGRLWSAAKEQKVKLYIIKKCIAMLICGCPNKHHCFDWATNAIQVILSFAITKKSLAKRMHLPVSK